MKFLGASAVAVLLLGLLFLRVTSCSPAAKPGEAPLGGPREEKALA